MVSTRTSCCRALEADLGAAEGRGAELERLVVVQREAQDAVLQAEVARSDQAETQLRSQLETLEGASLQSLRVRGHIIGHARNNM